MTETATCATSALTFHKTTFHPVIRDGLPWLSAAEIADALGYASDDAISRIYRRRAEEFTSAMTETVKLTVSGNLQKEARIFSLRGAHLVGMLARTASAGEFRRWVLDILDRETAVPSTPVSKRQTVVAAKKSCRPRSTFPALQEPAGSTAQTMRPPAVTRSLPSGAPGAVRTIHVARQVISELKLWGWEELPRDVAATFNEALDELNSLLTTGWTEVDEALRCINTSMRYLQRWQGRQGA